MNCTRLMDRVGNQGLSATKITEHARCRAQACRFSHFIMVFALHHDAAKKELEQVEALDIFWMAFSNKKFGIGLGFGLRKALKTGPIGPVSIIHPPIHPSKKKIYSSKYVNSTTRIEPTQHQKPGSLLLRTST